MATKSKSESVSMHPPRTRSGYVPEPNSSPRTRSGCVPESKSAPRTDRVARTLFPPDIVTPVGTLKSVVLDEWWLKKGKEKGLCVSGFEIKGGGAIRKFSSGAITKRHDSNTLETIDGITVTLSGFLDRTRSLQNGISFDLCNRFNFGFPYDWNEDEDESVETKNKAFGFDFSFDDIPVRNVNDLLLTSNSSLRSKILDDVVEGLRGFAYGSTQESEKECEKSGMDDNDYNGDDESLVPRVVGAKTRSMLKRVHETSKKKRS